MDGLCKAHCNEKTFPLVSMYSFSFRPVFFFLWLVGLGFLLGWAFYFIFVWFFPEMLCSSTSFIILSFAKNIQFDCWSQSLNIPVWFASNEK